MNRNLLSIVLMISGVTIAADSSTPRFGIGQDASLADISTENLTVLPDGTGLPPGSGTARQGGVIYRMQCAACHGDRGEGRGDFPALVGGRDTLTGPTPALTVGSYWPYATTIFDYIRRAMPYQTPGALSDDNVYALTAWILAENRIIDSARIMNRFSLTKVRMPNRDGFIPDPRPDLQSPSQ